MDAAEHDSVAQHLRRQNKGPQGAVIRTVSAADAEHAFNDEAGGRGPAMPGDHKAGGAGGKGSTAGIRVGSGDAAGGADARVIENRIRREMRSQGAGRTVRPATVVPPARTPVQTALEPWEVDALQPPAPARQEPAQAPARTAYVPATDGTDALERARLRALHTLASLPEGTELFVGGQGLGPEGVEFVMGLGLLVGKGQAVYRGDSHYRLNEAGRTAAATEGYGA